MPGEDSAVGITFNQIGAAIVKTFWAYTKTSIGVGSTPPFAASKYNSSGLTRKLPGVNTFNVKEIPPIKVETPAKTNKVLL